MSNSYAAAKLSRAEKLVIGRQIEQNLIDRAAQGPSEPALDAFIPPLSAILQKLEHAVEGKTNAEAARAEGADLQEIADAEVDTCLRHIESFLDIQRRKAHSPYAILADTMHTATFPQGTEIVYKHVAEENIEARQILRTLQTPEHTSALEKMKFPMAWLDDLSIALDASDNAFRDRSEARTDRGEQVKRGKDAETEWQDLITRLRKYLDARAPLGNTERKHEADRLLAPLDSALALAKATATARKTRNANRQAEKTTG